MGYAAGPRSIVQEMAKIQQFTFVCAPSMAQAGCKAAFDVDLSPIVASYRHRRDMVLEALSPVTTAVEPGGAFYVFVEVPSRLGQTGTAFVERAIERNVLMIPGGVFSQRDTHFRISYATSEAKLAEGLEILREMMTGG